MHKPFLSLKAVGGNAFELPDFFSCSKSIAACWALFLTRYNNIFVLLSIYNIFVLLLQSQPASQEREHKLANKSCSQNCPDSCGDTDHKQYFL